MPRVFHPAAGVVEVVMSYQQFDQHFESVWHFDNVTPADETALANLAAFVQGWESSTASLLRSDTVSLFEIKATALDLPTSPQVVVAVSPPVVGTQSGVALPGNVTLAVAIRSAVGRRWGVGRNYWVGLTQDDVVGNLMVTGSRDNLVAAIDALRAAADTNLKPLSVLSRRYGGSYRSNGIAYHIDTVTADLNVDSQRRRLTGRGI